MPGPDATLWAEIFGALDAGVVVIDGQGKIVCWNEWIASATGIDAAGALGSRLADVLPDTWRRISSTIADALTFGAARVLTHSLHPALLPLKTRAGRVLMHDVSVRGIGTAPNVRCLIQVFDVTVATERERVLRARQNARYAAVVDHAPDAILTIDAEGIIRLANPAASREFGYLPTELIGREIGDLFEDGVRWGAAWRSALTDPVSQQRPVELVARRKDGSPSHVEFSAARWISDAHAFVSAIFRDVNERHAADAALRRLNETLEERVATALAERKLLADIVENTDAHIQVIDLDYRLMAVNRASADECEAVFGIRPEIGANVLDLYRGNPVDEANARALWSRALAGETFTAVQAFCEGTARARHYELKFNALRDGTGRQVAAFQFVYDVSERLERQAQLARTEEALRQAQKMEAIGQLTGGIAHDFNNLLTGIIGAMNILKRRLAAGKYEDTQRFMDAAESSAYRAAALTHRLLAFARRQPLDPQATDANHLISGIEDLLRRTLGEQVRLSTDLAPDLWQTFADHNQLENAILNLAINARDAMAEGGRLLIATRNAKVAQETRFAQDEVAPGEYTVITVSDTGVGMTSDVIAKAFEPFFTTKPLGKGTGLGLSMIYGFVKQSRGAVRIESTPGKGTSVSLYLPRHVGDPEEQAGEASRHAPQGEGEAVLLVEDDASVRLLIGEVLRDLGYSCIEASDGTSALSLLSSNTRLDLMITDVGLPGMDGQKLAEFARRHRPGLKILFVTGYADHVTEGATLLEPGMELLTKPFTLDALAYKVRAILAGHARH